MRAATARRANLLVRGVSTGGDLALFWLGVVARWPVRRRTACLHPLNLGSGPPEPSSIERNRLAHRHCSPRSRQPSLRDPGDRGGRQGHRSRWAAHPLGEHRRPRRQGRNHPDWMKEIVAEAVMEDRTYGYSPTKGVLATREFLAEQTNKRGRVQITAEDIIFFNGLGDAISKVYGFLRRTARVIVPTPSYTTHSSAEAAHVGDKPLTYILDPEQPLVPGPRRSREARQVQSGDGRHPDHQSRQSDRRRLSDGDPASRSSRSRSATTCSSSATRSIRTSSTTARAPRRSPR